MGNQTSSTNLESQLTNLTFESLETNFNQVVTGKDPADPTTPLMTRSDFSKQFPTFSMQKLFGQPSFNLFDMEQVDLVDFSSFFGGLTILLNSKVDTKIDALFRLLDPAGNGILQEYELLGFVEKTLVHLQQIDPSIHWNEQITFDPTTILSGSVSTTGQNGANTSSSSLNPLQNSTSNFQTSLSQQNPDRTSLTLSQSTLDKSISSNPHNNTSCNINGNNLSYQDEIFQEIPLSFGPVILSLDSQSIVNQAFLSIGKPLPTTSTSTSKQNDSTKNNNSYASNDLSTANRTVDKREFREFIQKSPQLYMIVMWILNLSVIQHICSQTRLEFIQQCELQLCPLFPMKETQLIESYQQFSNFFHELLLRRLSLVNTIQPGSLLQQDLITMEEHFNLTSNTLLIDGLGPNTAPSISGQNPLSSSSGPNVVSQSRASPSRRTSSSRLSFSRQPDGTSLLDEAKNTNTADRENTLLSLKITPINFPYTHHLTDQQIHQATFASPITPSTTQTVPQFTPIPTPRVQTSSTTSSTLPLSSSTSNNTTDPVLSTTSLSRTPSSSYRDSINPSTHQSTTITSTTRLPTAQKPLPYSIPQFIPQNTKAPFSISLTTPHLNTTPIEFSKLHHPGTIHFCLYFIHFFKLQHLLHRNRLASKVLCFDLISSISTDLNSNYVDLITKQYIYETQKQFTAKGQGNDGKGDLKGGDINQRLMLILNNRKKEGTNTHKSQQSQQSHENDQYNDFGKKNDKNHEKSTILTISSTSSKNATPTPTPTGTNTSNNSPQQGKKGKLIDLDEKSEEEKNMSPKDEKKKKFKKCKKRSI